MSIILKYGAAALVFLGIIAASHYSAYQWGHNAARLEQSNQANTELAKQAQAAINHFSYLQSVEDKIISSGDTSRIKSPVLMRTLERVSDCSGKTQCPASSKSMPK